MQNDQEMRDPNFNANNQLPATRGAAQRTSPTSLQAAATSTAVVSPGRDPPNRHPDPVASPPTVPAAAPPTVPAAAPPVSTLAPAAPTRTELVVRKGIYKGRNGYLDTTRGANGYSPTGKSVYISCFDDNGAERLAGHYIRISSVEFVRWSLPIEVANAHTYLQSNPLIGQRISEFESAIKSITFPDQASAHRFRRDIIDLLNHLIPPP